MKQRVYIHRAGQWYPLFMDRENEALLRSFVEVVCEGPREKVLEANELVRRMSGCLAVLSLNGCGAGEITLEVLQEAGSVRLISRSHYWGQFDNIPASLGIQVVDGSNAGTVAVAEWCLAAALMGVRRLHMFDAELKAGSAWGEHRRSVGILTGRTAGLIGLGRIGLYVARMFTALGLNVIACSRSCSPETAATLGIRLVNLDELLATSSIVSLHQGVNENTRNRLGAREFALIQPGAVFINSARAALYDEKALVNELGKGRYLAFLDVFAVEPLPLNHPFRRMRNVILTPHIAGNNVEMFRRCARESILGLRDYFAGKGIVDRRYVYP
jgi:phosphoglycerate dehydrogenase-like enzyme